MRKIALISLLAIACGSDKPKVDYQKQLNDLEYANICAKSMITLCRVLTYQEAQESFVEPDKYDQMTKSPISDDSMIVLFCKYFPTIDSALNAQSPYGEYDEQMLDIEREYQYKVAKAQIEFNAKLTEN